MVEVIKKSVVKNTLVLVFLLLKRLGFRYLFNQKLSVLWYVLPCAKRLFLLACLIFFFFLIFFYCTMHVWCSHVEELWIFTLRIWAYLYVRGSGFQNIPRKVDILLLACSDRETKAVLLRCALFHKLDGGSMVLLVHRPAPACEPQNTWGAAPDSTEHLILFIANHQLIYRCSTCVYPFNNHEAVVKINTTLYVL